jgi:ArsR family transcriptional regulator
MSIASQAQRALCCQRGVALDQDQAVEFAALFKALSDPVRLRLLTLIAAAASEEDGACVCDLTASFDLSQPTISHHLKVLREVGLVESRRRGTWVHYWVAAGCCLPGRAVLDLIDGSAAGPVEKSVSRTDR